MSDSLSDSLAALAAAAREAGVDETTARAEGEALAATVAERSKGAFVDWAEQTGRPGGAEEFFMAAKQGNRFRGGPTPLMDQLLLEKSAHAPTTPRRCPTSRSPRSSWVSPARTPSAPPRR